MSCSVKSFPTVSRNWLALSVKEYVIAVQKNNSVFHMVLFMEMVNI